MFLDSVAVFLLITFVIAELPRTPKGRASEAPHLDPHLTKLRKPISTSLPSIGASCKHIEFVTTGAQNKKNRSIPFMFGSLGINKSVIITETTFVISVNHVIYLSCTGHYIVELKTI